jgi:hypothetical protein
VEINHGDFWESVGRVNTPALHVCTVSGLPSVVLQTVLGLIRRVKKTSQTPVGGVEALAEKLLSLYPFGMVKPDKAVLEEVRGAVDYILGLMLFGRERGSLSSVLYDLVYICGEFGISHMQKLENLRKVVVFVKCLEGRHGYDSMLRLLMHVLPGLSLRVAMAEDVVTCLEKARKVNEENSKSYWKEEEHYGHNGYYVTERMLVPENEGLKAKAQEIARALKTLRGY